MIEELEPLDMLDISTNEQGIKTYKATDKLMSYHMNYTRWLFMQFNYWAYAKRHPQLQS